MSTDDANFSPPDPVYVSIVAGFIRTIVAAGAGFGFGWALGVTGEQIAMIATMLVLVITAGWSAYQKVQAHRKRAAAAVASAVQSAEATMQAGQPVAVVVANPKPADQVP
jgi:hypothetical protein